MWLCQHGFTAAQRALVLAAACTLCELDALTRDSGALPCLELGARRRLRAALDTTKDVFSRLRKDVDGHPDDKGAIKYHNGAALHKAIM